MQPPLLRREAFKQNKALAINEILPQIKQHLGQIRQREVRLADPRQLHALLHKHIRRSSQFGDLSGGEAMGPGFGVLAILLGLPDGGTADFLGEGGIGLQLFVDGVMLPRCADAVGEDGTGGVVVVADFGVGGLF